MQSCVVMSSFKNFARKTQPLAWKIPALPKEAKRKITFDITKDLKEGDQIYYVTTEGRHVVGTFTRYGTNSPWYPGELEVWANWRGEEGWMPVSRVYLQE